MTSAVAGTPPFREARLSNLEVMLPLSILSWFSPIAYRTGRHDCGGGSPRSRHRARAYATAILSNYRKKRAGRLDAVLKIMNRRPGRCLIYSGNSFAEKLRHF
jgi:hypothetical protein